MFKTGQHVEITSPRLLEILARRKSQPFGTVVAVDPQTEYPVKVRITDDTGFQIPFTFDGELQALINQFVVALGGEAKR